MSFNTPSGWNCADLTKNIVQKQQDRKTKERRLRRDMEAELVGEGGSLAEGVAS